VRKSIESKVGMLYNFMGALLRKIRRLVYNKKGERNFATLQDFGSWSAK
jgi:hypothetical protein